MQLLQYNLQLFRNRQTEVCGILNYGRPQPSPSQYIPQNSPGTQANTSVSVNQDVVRNAVPHHVQEPERKKAGASILFLGGALIIVVAMIILLNSGGKPSVLKDEPGTVTLSQEMLMAQAMQTAEVSYSLTQTVVSDSVKEPTDTPKPEIPDFCEKPQYEIKDIVRTLGDPGTLYKLGFDDEEYACQLGIIGEGMFDHYGNMYVYYTPENIPKFIRIEMPMKRDDLVRREQIKDWSTAALSWMANINQTAAEGMYEKAFSSGESEPVGDNFSIQIMFLIRDMEYRVFIRDSRYR